MAETETTLDAPLKSAAAASDPAVHQLLALIQNAHLLGDEDKVLRLRAQLRELGYE